MGLKIGDTAPDFEADTSQGKVSFHDWIGDSWAVLFSHPKDFTPVCTTELGYMAKLGPEFDKRDVKVIGLSVDSTTDHEAWAEDIEETQGARPNHNQTVRNVFVVGPDKKVKLILVYPMTTGRNFDEVLRVSCTRTRSPTRRAIHSNLSIISPRWRRITRICSSGHAAPFQNEWTTSNS